jgi:hypothetical protein
MSRAGGSGRGGGGSAGTGGSSAGSGGQPAAGTSGSSGSGGSAGMGAGGAGCEAKPSYTEAIHYVLDVDWPATTAAAAGSGKVHLWIRVHFDASGTELTGELYPCGLVLPEANLTIAGQLATGGDKVLIDVPDAVWDAPSVPATPITGTQSGFGMGSTVEQSSTALQGVVLADPTAAWPASGVDAETSDFDDDDLPGYTATPREGDGYVLPPTEIGLRGSAPSADLVYLVSRVGMLTHGMRTACDAHSGTGEVTAFDYHVVGCHVSGAEECDADQTDFVDQNRMVYVASSASYEAKVVADDASCADVRAALPEQ